MSKPLAERLAEVRAALNLSKERAAADAMVATETLVAAEAGFRLRPLSIERLEKWVERAERRLERRLPRP